MNDSPVARSDRSNLGPPEKIGFWTKMAFGAGDLGPAITAMVQVTFSLIFLTNVVGMNAGLAGSALMIGKVWDAVNDPIVGVLSDRTRSKWGRRYPWMLFGAIPFGIFFFLLWIVPDMSQTQLFWYYVLISIGFNTAYTAVNLPYTALTPEMTEDYDERTSLNSFRFAFSIGGSIGALLVALGISAIIPEPKTRYAILGGICAIASVLPIYWCVFGTKNWVLRHHLKGESAAEELPDSNQLKALISNTPFLFVIGIYLCSWFAVQNTVAIIPYFVENWMQLPGQTFMQVLLMVQAVAMGMLFPWTIASKRYGKRAVYFMGMAVWMIAQVGLFLLQPGQLAGLYFMAFLAGVGVSTAYLVPWSMLPDVIDVDELKTGVRREGIFYSLMVLLQKICLAAGIFVVGQALNQAGFIAKTASQANPTQPESALWAIRFFVGPLPLGILAIGVLLCYFYPITREVHAETLLRLAERKNRRADA